MQKKSRSFSILIVPEGESKTIHFKIRAFTFKALVFTLLVFIAGSVAGIVLAGRIALKVQLAEHLAGQNKTLQERNRKIESLAEKIAEIREKENRIRQMATTLSSKPERAGENIPAADSEKDLRDEWVSRMQKKQKTLDVLSSEEGFSRQNRIQLSVPTLRPLDGWITRGFSLQESPSAKYGGHRGIDIAAATGTPILGAAPGLVIFSGWHKFFGNLVGIDHGYGYETYYGHCSRILVKKGDWVKRGETVALVGNSGKSTAPHLHYEIRKNHSSVDPLLFFIY